MKCCSMRDVIQAFIDQCRLRKSRNDEKKCKKEWEEWKKWEKWRKLIMINIIRDDNRFNESEE